jgi:S-DNA-T family DNA segregation ATPase FtsK/SpoIIIE
MDDAITDNAKVVNTLNSLCVEMDNRYSLLKDAMVRNIKNTTINLNLEN